MNDAHNTQADKKQAVIIYGFGGFGREVAWLAQQAGYKVRYFVDDNKDLAGSRWSGIPIVNHFDDALATNPDDRFVVAVGSPQVKEQIAERLAGYGVQCANLIHPNVCMSDTAQVGAGSLICAGSILTVDIEIGQHVHINLDCTVGHDVRIGHYSTLAPSVNVSGNVHIGERVYIGTGASIRNGTPDKPLIIDDDSVIGMGAVVIKDVPAHTTVMGNPAKPR